MSEGEIIDVPAVREPQNIVRVSPGDVAEAFDDYRKVQATLDRAMPDCIMTIQGRQFRKKAYWRGIATAFNLRLELVAEERVEHDGDWGWLATYRAHAGNGRCCDGDGACFASEKATNQASEHNVRAHAHTRAKNRAISDLVGFGEVSAEEMMDSPRPAAPRRQAPQPTRDAAPVDGDLARFIGPKGLAQDGTWPVGKYKGKALVDLPSDFLVWAVKNMTDKPMLHQAAQAEVERRRNEALGRDEEQPPPSEDVPF